MKVNSFTRTFIILALGTFFIPKIHAEATYRFSNSAQDGLQLVQLTEDNNQENNKDLPPDYEKYAMAVKGLAQNGYPPLQYDLANLYKNGQGVPPDYEKYAMWLEKAASQGQYISQVHLCLVAYKNTPNQPFWCEKLAEKGIKDAQYLLGNLYSTGKYVPKDIETAKKWYRKAANQGDVNALNRLKSLGN